MYVHFFFFKSNFILKIRLLYLKDILKGNVSFWTFIYYVYNINRFSRSILNDDNNSVFKNVFFFNSKFLKYSTEELLISNCVTFL